MWEGKTNEQSARVEKYYDIMLKRVHNFLEKINNDIVITSTGDLMSC